MFKQIVPTVMLLVCAMISTTQANEVYWKKQSVAVNISGAGGISEFSSAFARVMIQHNYFECGYYLEPEFEVVQGTCYDTQCSDSGSGKSPVWDAFYSAKKEDKANRLAAAIKGIGKKTADSLVAENAFNSKPRSWNEFKTEINRLVAANVISTQISTLVLSTYRDDNMQNLGYSSGGCTSTSYACEETRIVREGEYISQTCDNPIEQPIESKQVNYKFDVKNSVLLPSEQERLTFNLSGDPAEITLDPTYYNVYEFSVQQGSPDLAIVSVVGTARKQVILPQGSVQTVELISLNPKSARLQIKVSEAILPANATESLVVSYEVKSCIVGWTKTCGFGWDKKETFQTKITSAVSDITVSSPLVAKKNGLRMEVDVKIFKQNSLYHNASPISKGSKTINLK